VPKYLQTAIKLQKAHPNSDFKDLVLEMIITAKTETSSDQLE